MAPMEAHARTLPMRVQRRLPAAARRHLGLSWEHFFQSQLRLAPLPRGPLGAVRFVADALVEGYAPPHHPRLIRQSLELLELPPALAPLPTATHACARRARRGSGRTAPPWLVCLASLVVGLLLGCNLTLERVRM
jgi:hypothetical protein